MTRTTASSIDELVVYAVKRILDAGEESTFERLVYECFTLFPKTFGLKRYPDWPDSARINKSWLRCRTDRGWLVGSVQQGFRLTEAGSVVAKRVGQRLEGGAETARAGPSGRSRERFEALLRTIRSDPLFSRFGKEGLGFKLTEMDFRRLLGATLETPDRVLRQNLNAYLNAAETYEDEEVIKFLKACENSVLASPGANKMEDDSHGRKRG